MNGSALVAYGLLCGRGCCFDKIRRAWINFVGEGCQEDSSDICMLGLIAHFAFFPKMRLLAFAVLALFAVTQAEEGARLLASKSLLNRYAVEGRDLTLQYNIYNVGSR